MARDNSIVAFAPWRPDTADLNTGTSFDVMNVLLANKSYIPFPKLEPYSGAITGQPNGGFTARNGAGQVEIFVGTATKLWKLNGTGWDDVSTGTYNASIDERWRFAQFGDFVIAVNANDDPQVFELGVSTDFIDLAGSPPRARYVAVWGDFLALGGLTGFENRVHWSGINDIEEWTPGTANCDFQDFPDGGDVMGMTSATNPIVFQKAAIRFGTFVPGSIEVFTFVKVHDKRGAAAPYSIASRGDYTFFVDNGTFNQIFTSGEIKSIGLEKVDRTVFETISGADLFGVMGEVDPIYNRVYFAVKYDSTDDTFDRLLIYDWGLEEWTQVTNNTDVLFPLASGTIGITLEGLDAISASLDALPFSLDSKVWQGGAPIMAAIDADHKLSFFSGLNAEATITTHEFGQTNGMMQRITEVMPIIDTNNVLLSYGTRNKRGDTMVWSGEFSPSTNTGISRRRTRARFTRIKVRIPEDVLWNHAQGIDHNGAPAGYR